MMTKITSIIILMIIAQIRISAQFVGYYNLGGGGVDTSNSQLVIFPNHEFAITNLEDFQYGTWKEDGNNKIICTQTKNENPISIAGYKGKNTKNAKSRLRFSYFEGKDVYLGYAKDGQTPEKFFPIFNKGANCTEINFIEKDLKDIKSIQLIVHSDPYFNHTGYKYPYEATVYSFPVSSQYLLYDLIYDESSSYPKIEFMVEKKGKNFEVNGQDIGEQKELRDNLFNEFSAYKEKTENQLKRGYEMNGENILVSKISDKMMDDNNEEPLLIAKCKDGRYN